MHCSLSSMTYLVLSNILSMEEYSCVNLHTLEWSCCILKLYFTHNPHRGGLKDILVGAYDTSWTNS
jgi:hypothetical protein